MKKLFWMVVILLSLWLLKLSIDIYTVDQSNVAELKINLSQQNQKIASLNDQIVALQKNLQSITLPENNQKMVERSVHIEHGDDANINYEKIMIKDRLDLISILLQQKQYSAAVEQIQGLKQKIIDKQPLSESVNGALIEALSRDKNAISLYLQQSTEQQMLLQQELQYIDVALNPVQLTRKDDQWRFSSWFNVSRPQGIPDLKNRDLIYQQQKLKLLLAQHALYTGQLNFYYAQLKQIQQDLRPFPDMTSQQIIKRIKKIENKQIIAPPTLSAVSFFEGE